MIAGSFNMRRLLIAGLAKFCLQPEAVTDLLLTLP